MNDLVYYLQYIPFFIVGAVCGFIKFTRDEIDLIKNTPEDRINTINNTKTLRGVETILTGSLTCVVSYVLIAYFTQWPYAVSFSLAVGISLYGIEEAINLVNRIINLKKPS